MTNLPKWFRKIILSWSTSILKTKWKKNTKYPGQKNWRNFGIAILCCRKLLKNVKANKNGFDFCCIWRPRGYIIWLLINCPHCCCTYYCSESILYYKILGHYLYNGCTYLLVSSIFLYCYCFDMMRGILGIFVKCSLRLIPLHLTQYAI